MYRIMILKSERDNYQSLYQYLTTTVDGKTVPLEIENKDELDAYVEDMLNNGGYAKSDFIVMNYIDYAIDAHDYSDDEDSDTVVDAEETEEDAEAENGETTEDEAIEEDENSDSDADADAE